MVTWFVMEKTSTRLAGLFALRVTKKKMHWLEILNVKKMENGTERGQHAFGKTVDLLIRL